MEVRPGYKQTEVGVLPEEWEALPARDIGVFKGGSGFPLTAQGEASGEYPFLKVSDMNSEGNETFMTTANHYISEQTRKRLGVTAFPTGSIVFAKVGAAVFLERKKILGQPSCIDNNMTAFVLDKTRADVRYVHSLLLSKKLGALVATTALPALNGKQLGEMALAVPPLPEQRAIAAALSDVDALLSGLDRLIAKKRDLKQAAMQQLLTGQTRLPGFSGAWKNTTLGQIISRFSTGLNPRQNFRLNNGGNFFYVTIKNFAVGQLLLDENCDLIDEAAFWRINERSDLRKDDVLFSSIGRVGDAYLITETPRNWNINESVFTLRPDKTQVVPLMLFYLLTDKIVTDALSQGVTGSTFKSIKQAQLKAIPCQLPALLEEQTAIATVLSDMDAELAALEARRDKTRDLKQAMMQELLTGRTRLV
jgi:type I restriction enzyme S subunit